jgi:hypothetical protein
MRNKQFTTQIQKSLTQDSKPSPPDLEASALAITPQGQYKNNRTKWTDNVKQVNKQKLKANYGNTLLAQQDPQTV